MEDRCVCCGKIVPEGRQICWKCEHTELKYGTILQAIEATKEETEKVYEFIYRKDDKDDNARNCD